ncbi:RNA polymerase subunit sigma-24, partial [Streptomyces sp. Da 82-17]
MSVGERDESVGRGRTAAEEAQPQVPKQRGEGSVEPQDPGGREHGQGLGAQDLDAAEDELLAADEGPSSDAELITAMRAGEDSAYEELY